MALNTLFLGKRVVHPHHGVGFFTFEEDISAKKNRTLQATFEDGKTITGCVVIMAGLGVRWTDGRRLDLPAQFTRLNGHHGADGLGLDINATLERLAAEVEQRRLTAA